MAEYPAPHPADPVPPVDAAQRARVGRGARIAVIVVLVLLAIGAGRTIVGRMANARILETNVTEGAVQYVRTTVARTSEGGITIQPTRQPVMQKYFENELITSACDESSAAVTAGNA